MMFINKVSKGEKIAVNEKSSINNKQLTYNKFNPLTSITLSVSLFILTLLSISLISAAQIDFIKNSSSFDQGETLIAKVSGNFLQDPTSDNVFFYRDHVRIPMIYEIGEVDGAFYVYAMLTGKTKGNYSIALEGVTYMSGIQESQEDIVKNFTISNNTADFSITPGYIIQLNTSSTFSINVQNLKSNQITLSIDPPNGVSSITSTNIQSGEIKEIVFQMQDDNPFSDKIALSSGNTDYEIPLFITSNITGTTGTNGENNDSGGSGTGTNGNNNDNTDDEESFRFEPSVLNISMSTNSETKRIIYIVNTGNVDIKKINFKIPSYLDPYLDIVYPKTLDVDASERVEITIESGSEGNITKGEIKVEAEGSKSSFNITLNFIPDYIPSGDDDNPVLTSCSQLGGDLCSSDEKCAGEVEKVKDGVCCLKPAVCQPAKSGSSTKKIIGWSLVGVVLLFLLWFFRRYRRVRPQINMFGRR